MPTAHMAGQIRRKAKTSTHEPNSTLFVEPFSGGFQIAHHHHLFAAWAACRAASVINCRFKVSQGRDTLEKSGLSHHLATPDQLPHPSDVDSWHRDRRVQAVKVAKKFDIILTHGVAAKLINIYLKCFFVCGGHHAHEQIHALHPPIDDEILRALIAGDVGGYKAEWRQARKWRWSKFTSDQYELVIGLIRESLNGRPLWTIEEHWKGNQTEK